MLGAGQLVNNVSYYLAVAATLEESGNDDAAANFQLINEPMVTEESTTIQKQSAPSCEAYREQESVERWGETIRSVANQSMENPDQPRDPPSAADVNSLSKVIQSPSHGATATNQPKLDGNFFKERVKELFPKGATTYS
jgi:hypothetical protein